MTSKNRRKGNRSRLLAIKELEEDGWLVDVVEKTSRYAKNKDLFDLFDLIAIKKGVIQLIQISTNTNHPHKAYSEFNEKYGNPHLLISQWVKKDYKKEFIKHEYAKW